MNKSTITAVLIVAATVASATQYSCLSIISESKKLGKWPALKSWIAAADLEDEWGKCQYVSDTYPQFAAITNALVVSGVVTSVEVAEILAASIDTAMPDDLLMRRYRSDVKTGSGRVQWHGKLVTQIVDTNLWQRTSVYADGTRFVDAATRPATPPAATQRAAVAMTNGIPARLAAARKRWAAAQNTASNVTVVVTAGQ